MVVLAFSFTVSVVYTIKVDEHDNLICNWRRAFPMVNYKNSEIIFIVEESPDGVTRPDHSITLFSQKRIP
jgi:hypothetical protein